MVNKGLIIGGVLVGGVLLLSSGVLGGGGNGDLDKSFFQGGGGGGFNILKLGGSESFEATGTDFLQPQQEAEQPALFNFQGLINDFFNQPKKEFLVNPRGQVGVFLGEGGVILSSDSGEPIASTEKAVFFHEPTAVASTEKKLFTPSNRTGQSRVSRSRGGIGTAERQAQFTKKLSGVPASFGQSRILRDVGVKKKTVQRATTTSRRETTHQYLKRKYSFFR